MSGWPKYAVHTFEAITVTVLAAFAVYAGRLMAQTSSSAGIPPALVALVAAPAVGAGARLVRELRETVTRYRNWRDQHLADLTERDTTTDDDPTPVSPQRTAVATTRAVATTGVAGELVAESAGHPADEGDQDHEQDDRNGRTESDPNGREAIEDGQRSVGATSTDARDRGRYVAGDETERFWAFVDRAGHPRGCWVWTGGLTDDGYGRFALADGREVRAHRWAYQQLVGAIADGLTIDHHDQRCRNRACVRPDHLEPVTRAENTRRAAAWRRAHSNTETETETDQETPR